MLLDELLAWLTEAQALLHTKTKDPIPEDLTVVEALIREHLVGTPRACMRTCVHQIDTRLKFTARKCMNFLVFLV